MRRVCPVALALPITIAVVLAARTSRAQTAPDPLAPVSGGVTAEQVGARAMAASYSVEAASELADAASARADQARAGFIPRVTTTARYTRLSSFDPIPLLDPPAGRLVVTRAESGTANPTPTQAAELPVPVIPVLIDQYLTQLAVIVPVSDYFLRIGKSYTAATHAEDAARLDLIAAKAKSYTDGKIAYYTWVRARGALVVAQQTLAVAHAHQRDAEALGTTGSASRMDVLRARTAVATAELMVERSKNAASLAEFQVRLAIHAQPEEKVEPGEPLDAAPPVRRSDRSSLLTEAKSTRAEIKSIDHNAEAARKLASAARAGYIPALSAFGDVTYANPNPRRFPPRDEWFTTWAVGAQLTWSPTEIFSSAAAASDAAARASALDAQKKAVRDGIELEVVQSLNAVREADVAIATTSRGLESATEGYRVAKDLYAAGRGTSTALSEAEAALAQARFDSLNARVDARVARVRLEHATGRDTHALQ